MRFRLLLMALTLVLFVSQSEAQQGTIKGQFLLEGASPLANAPPRVMKGDMTARDWEVCAQANVPEEMLLVDEKSKGIANVVVYLKKAPQGMPEALKTPKVKTLTFDQKGCRFEPRILPVQVGQTVNCTSQDAKSHNLRTAGFANETVNSVITPNSGPLAVNLVAFENLPMAVRCDYHPWMDAYWVVTNHPYAAVTDAEGKFSISGLPPGEHKFTVWHELGGYLPVPGGKKTFDLTVAAGVQKIPAIKVPADHFAQALAKQKK